MKIPNSEFRIPNYVVGAILSAVTDSVLHPLARWDGLHLVLDLLRVERHINEYLRGNDMLDDVSLRGAGDALAAEVTVVVEGHSRPGGNGDRGDSSAAPSYRVPDAAVAGARRCAGAEERGGIRPAVDGKSFFESIFGPGDRGGRPSQMAAAGARSSGSDGPGDRTVPPSLVWTGWSVGYSCTGPLPVAGRRQSRLSPLNSLKRLDRRGLLG